MYLFRGRAVRGLFGRGGRCQDESPSVCPSPAGLAPSQGRGGEGKDGELYGRLLCTARPRFPLLQLQPSRAACLCFAFAFSLHFSQSSLGVGGGASQKIARFVLSRHSRRVRELSVTSVQWVYCEVFFSVVLSDLGLTFRNSWWVNFAENSWLSIFRSKFGHFYLFFYFGGFSLRIKSLIQSGVFSKISCLRVESQIGSPS